MEKGELDPFYLGLRSQFASCGAMALWGNMSMKTIEHLCGNSDYFTK